ncbi:MAG: 1,4-beta-xylanase [Planctomycetes bacterium]|nr:1,4-beta-xylanase [Planctomycetota bacterium]
MINAQTTRFLFVCFAILLVRDNVSAEDREQSKTDPEKQPAPFSWVNPLPDGKYPLVQHATFESPSMAIDVGYCIYLPPQYGDRDRPERRFPVVYYLHGGRPGSEIKSVGLSSYVHEAVASGKVPPAIYVFVNGGEVSHYDYPEKKSLGEDVFTSELIPHVDRTYRTIADRSGRGLEGFSQGGRGTTRIMFKHPQLFCSAAPGGAGHATEKSISENDGRENESLKFAPGYNTYDLARQYAKHPEPPLNFLNHVGTAGFNYENNLAYLKFLRTLKIPFDALFVPDATHSAREIYEAAGLEIMRFHAKNFAAAKR